MKTKLDKQQSQHLTSLGVPKEKASEKISYGFLGYDPIFRLTDILEILPKEIEAPISHLGTINTFFLNILYYRPCRASYIAEPYNYVLDVEYAEELIDSLYELCVWCLKNKFLKFQ